GRIGLSDLGKPTSEWIPGWVDEPERTGDRITGSVVTVDTFGNLISNIDASMVRDFNEPVVSVGQRELPMQQTYGRAAPGEYLALINSFGVVEVARAEGDAALGLGLGRGAPMTPKGTK
ncbi:MAG: SAM hydroxide adenosyltransferase, partial [Actinomycetota bacterium]